MKFLKKVRKDKFILKKIEKTKKEEYPDLEALHEQRMLKEKKEKFLFFKEEQKQKVEAERIKKEEEEKRSYKDIMDSANMKSNKVFNMIQEALNDDDFM